MAAPAARRGDAGVVHCSGYVIAQGSSNVYINGRPAARVGDPSTRHLKPGGIRCFPHVAKISQGSGTVYINNQPAARVGCALAGCTKVAEGSPDVIIGGPLIGSGSGYGMQGLQIAAGAAFSLYGPKLSDLI